MGRPAFADMLTGLANGDSLFILDARQKMKKFVVLFVLIAGRCVPSAWSQCGGVNVGGQCVPPPCAPGSPLACPNGQQDSGPAAASLFASFAVDNQMQINWSLNYPSDQAAQNAAVAGCNSLGHSGCRVLGGGFGNGCGVYALDPQGYIYPGFNYVAHLAERQAMEDCNKTSPIGRCHLLTSAICVGMRYPANKNNAAAKRGYAEMEEMSAKLDNRQYWGALAISDKDSNGVFDRASKAEAEQLALAKCPNCVVIAAYENSCIGLAWPNDKTKTAVSFNEVAIDGDHVAAKQKALLQCTQRYGSCTTSVRCSGRRYPKNNPDAPANPPSGR